MLKNQPGHREVELVVWQPALQNSGVDDADPPQQAASREPKASFSGQGGIDLECRDAGGRERLEQQFGDVSRAATDFEKRHAIGQTEAPQVSHLFVPASGSRYPQPRYCRIASAVTGVDVVRSLVHRRCEPVRVILFKWEDTEDSLHWAGGKAWLSITLGRSPRALIIAVSDRPFREQRRTEVQCGIEGVQGSVAAAERRTTTPAEP
jgi:hypothetical protein